MIQKQIQLKSRQSPGITQFKYTNKIYISCDKPVPKGPKPNSSEAGTSQIFWRSWGTRKDDIERFNIYFRQKKTWWCTSIISGTWEPEVGKSIPRLHVKKERKGGNIGRKRGRKVGGGDGGGGDK